ncbi:MAG: DUF2069 domain-containing protein [Pseudohongiellaceae bacterium]
MRVTLARLRLGVLSAYYGIILVLLGNSLYITAGLNPATPVFWIIQSFPLLIFAPSLHGNHFRAYGWLSFVVLLYFMHAVLLAFDLDRLILGLLDVTLCCALFILLLLYIRGYRRHFDVPL